MLLDSKSSFFQDFGSRGRGFKFGQGRGSFSIFTFELREYWYETQEAVTECDESQWSQSLINKKNSLKLKALFLDFLFCFDCIFSCTMM